MKIEKGKKHAWISPQYLILNGRIRRKGMEQPRRERIWVRSALRNLKIRYKELIPFYNPFYNGFRETQQGAIQWLDFIIQLPNKKIGVLIFQGHVGGGDKPYEKRALEAKKEYLEQRGAPFMVLERTLSEQEYQIKIMIFRKEQK